jgi:hypothetical protein
MNCPKCRKALYPVCGNPDCVCQARVPKGKMAMINCDDGESETCPYCGFTAHMDYWEDRSIEQFLKKNHVTSFSELQINKDKGIK